jgi:hypothetical protein
MTTLSVIGGLQIKHAIIIEGRTVAILIEGNTEFLQMGWLIKEGNDTVAAVKPHFLASTASQTLISK